ncbi:MAG: DUF1549 domain-containing protein [Planctomycetales bacterium]|nr:DUF1549 domain-containing protein [Planctomycetales bacterium]
MSRLMSRPMLQWVGTLGLAVGVPMAAVIAPIQAAQPKAVAKKTESKRPVTIRPASETTAGGKGPKVTTVASPEKDFRAVAKKTDDVILAELNRVKAPVAAKCSDEDFLRRVSLDIAGTVPSPSEVTLFGIDPSPDKRTKAVDRLLGTKVYAENWMRYWRDVILMRATEMRANLVRKSFEPWMTEQLQKNVAWDKITTEILTATGDIEEVGDTILVMAQGGEADEVASEASRIFLGIQIQCANCHDHPSDIWKREQFHQFAAFFTRVRLQQRNMPIGFEVGSVQGGGDGMRERFQQSLENPEELIRRMDRNGDKKISKEEASRAPGGGGPGLFARIIDLADTNKDGAVTAEELKKMPKQEARPGRGSEEYFMPDLNDPSSKGTRVDPQFFVNNAKPGIGLSDSDRRDKVSKYVTSRDNPWFARAFINRIWYELVGEGFYMPIDDLGPEREAKYPAALDALRAGFVANNYDIQWLFKAITATETYQRQIRPRDASQSTPAFASATPSRLRADQLFDSVLNALGLREADLPPPQFTGNQGPGSRLLRSQRNAFHASFSVDPSTMPEDIAGTVPQALYMMNYPLFAGQIRGSGSTRLAGILQKFPNDKDALTELFINVHAREPSATELKTCQEFIQQAKSRPEAYEDILWSLLNSTEFQTKR